MYTFFYTFVSMKITLTDMEFFARHGVFEEERVNGNIFRVNVSLDMAATYGCLTDNLNDTVDYQTIYDIVRHEMDIPSNLLEHVAQRIIDALVDQYEEADIDVCVSKKNPPLGGHVSWAGVTLTHRRP